MRHAAELQTILSCLLILQFALIVLHDWLDIPGWTHGRQVQSVIGRNKLLIATVINAIFPGLAVAFAIQFWRKPMPTYVTNYWMVYCAVTVASAVFMWYVPYLFGGSEKQKEEYSRMYAGTRHVLPERNGNPRPNALHIAFHILFVVNLCLAIAARVSEAG